MTVGAKNSTWLNAALFKAQFKALFRAVLESQGYLQRLMKL